MNDSVLDASGLLCAIRREPGMVVVLEAFEGRVFMSTVNLSEVVARLVRDGYERAEIERLVDGYSVQLVDFDAALALDAGLMWPETSRAGLSLGDRACIALARRLGLPCITTDRAWAALDLGVTIVVARP